MGCSVRSLRMPAPPGHTEQTGPFARSQNRCRNHAGRPGVGPAGQRLVRAAAGPGIRSRTPARRRALVPGQKSAGVFRKLVTRVAA
jgi:hypothetical protein